MYGSFVSIASLRVIKKVAVKTYILLLDSALVGDTGSGLRDVLNVVSGDDQLVLGAFSDGDSFKHRTLPHNLLAHCPHDIQKQQVRLRKGK